MKQIKVLIAEDNDETRGKFECLLKSKSNINLVGVAKTGTDALSLISSCLPDIVVTDIVLSGCDGFAVMDKCKKMGNPAKFLVISSLASESFVTRAIEMGAEYYMIKPVDDEILLERIMEIASKETRAEAGILKPATSKTKQLEEKISNIFITVGIPAHIKGYQFLREAIKLAICKPEIINSITKELYPSIADHFSTSASKVERAIRHAIEVAWSRGKIENINSVFGVKVYSNNEKPTNGEFIALVADKMLIEG